MKEVKSNIDNIQNDKEILNGVLSQINSFDSKAGILTHLSELERL